MEDSLWRPRAKFIAVTDIFLIAVSGILVAVAVCLIATGTFKFYVTDDTAIPILKTVYYAGGAWMSIDQIILATICLIIQLFAAISLLQAVEIGQTAKRALVKANHWEAASILFLTIYVVTSIFSLPFLVPLLVSIFLRAAGLLVVGRFTQEIQLSRTSPSAKINDDERNGKKESLIQDV